MRDYIRENVRVLKKQLEDLFYKKLFDWSILESINVIKILQR